MSQSFFSWPANQDVILQDQLTSPTNISGWSIQLDLMYRLNSPQPIYSAYAASGFNGVSGLTVVDGVKGVIQAPLYASIISGLMQYTNTLAYRTRRVDSGVGVDLTGGLIALTPY